MKRLLPALLFLLLFVPKAFSTHIRAGEITVRRVSTSSLTYEITVIGYTDTGSNIQFGQGEINMGDGTRGTLNRLATFNETILLGDEVAYNRFVLTHTYQAPSTYSISYQESYRNAGVLNMTRSVTTDFYIQTDLVIDPAFGLNSSPVLFVPPVDRGVVGAKFVHNPGGFDADGDSLSYKIWYPKQNRSDSVFNYHDPNNRIFYEKVDYNAANQDKDSVPSFTLDPIVGDLIWDAPGLAGEYNVAFIVEEWRLVFGEWRLLGRVTRDMQIIVEDSDNTPPRLVMPTDICVEAGDLVEEKVIGIDDDGRRVLLEAFGGPFELASSAATFSPDPPVFQETPGTLSFSWQTSCENVRQRPYEIRFKVTDEPSKPGGPKLVDFGTWNITVVAPAPKGLNASYASTGAIELSWDPYVCANAGSLQIWRRVDSFDFTPELCEVGMPAYAGYQLIGAVDAGAQTYTDDNMGSGLNPGASYCYRLVATFPDPEGGLSYASAEACAIVLAEAPVITNVDIVETSATAGEASVSWRSPFDLNKTDFLGPFTYEVLRGEGLADVVQMEVLGTTRDTVWADVGLNTLDKAYHYKVYLIDEQGNHLSETSPTASTVRTGLASDVESIEVSWDFEVPWSNNSPDFPMHFIYRNNLDASDADSFQLLSEVDVTAGGFQFIDKQVSSTETEYCYYVTTQGSYGNPAIAAPLLNRSQMICGYLDDQVPPCPPLSLRVDDAFSCETQIQLMACADNNFTNKIVWETETMESCQNDAVAYNIYFSSLGDEGSYDLIAQVATAEFVHSNLPSFKGCYRVAAVDRSGNESEWTDPVCNDNCPHFELPNVFTPNNDGKNDRFIPFYNDGTIADFDITKCMRFVKSVDFKVFDRNGKAVFQTNSRYIEGSVFINWEGQTEAGVDLPAGVYYYVAEVEFDVLNKEKAREELTGWVQLVR